MRTALIGLLTCVIFCGPARVAEPDQQLEDRALAALATGDRAALRSLAQEYRQLPPQARSKMSVRVRDDSVEFAFRGEFPADRSPWQMLEYLVSGPDKDYESLLVAPEAELKRVQGLRPVFDKRAGEGRRQGWSARLVWAEGGTPHSADLTDSLILIERGERDRFLDGLGIRDAGLGGSMNVNADPASLPRQRVPALLLLTIRIAPKD